VRRGEAIGSRGQRWALEIPEGRAERRRGLLGRDGLEPGAGMLFERASSVHTIGMRFPIAVAFLGRADAEGSRSVRRVRAMAPGRVAWPRSGVRAVLELPAGADVRVGDDILCRLPTAGSSACAPIV
jgi:uncharacterized membrane protein (UPF0127 family)